MTRIMVVDDEKIIREGLKKIIASYFMDALQIVEAASGQEALEIIEKDAVDICIVDIQMEPMDGITFVKLAIKRYPHMKYVVLSGYAEFEYAQKLMSLGCYRYLLKPVDHIELKICLEELIVQVRQKKRADKHVDPLLENCDDDAYAGRRVIMIALNMIRSQYNRPGLSLNEVADAVHMNASYFSALFKKDIAINFTDYLIRYRIEKAKELLPDVRYKIYEVGAKVGYPNQKHFSKTFQRLTGMSPTEYRDSIHLQRE